MRPTNAEERAYHQQFENIDERTREWTAKYQWKARAEPQSTLGEAIGRGVYRGIMASQCEAHMKHPNPAVREWAARAWDYVEQDNRKAAANALELAWRWRLGQIGKLR